MPRIHHWKIGVVLLLFALPSGRAAALESFTATVSFYQGVSLASGMTAFDPRILTLIFNPSDHVELVLSPESQETLFAYADDLHLSFGYDPSSVDHLLALPQHLAGLAVLRDMTLSQVTTDTLAGLTFLPATQPVAVTPRDLLAVLLPDNTRIALGNVTQLADWTLRVTYMKETLLPVPEPATWALLGLGGVVLLGPLFRTLEQRGATMKTIMVFLAVSVLSWRAGAAAAAELTVTKEGSGEGTVVGSGIFCDENKRDCTEIYPDETILHLKAFPNPGSQFKGWFVGGQPQEGTLVIRKDITVTAIFEWQGQSGSELEIVKSSPFMLNDQLLIFNTRNEVAGFYRERWDNGMAQGLISLKGKTDFLMPSLLSYLISSADGNRIIAYGEPRTLAYDEPMRLEVAIYSSDGELIKHIESGIVAPFVLDVDLNGNIWMAGKHLDKGAFVIRKYSFDGEPLWETPLEIAPKELSVSFDGNYAALVLMDSLYSAATLIRYYASDGGFLKEQEVAGDNVECMTDQMVIVYGSDSWKLYRFNSLEMPVASGLVNGEISYLQPIVSFPEYRIFLLQYVLNEQENKGVGIHIIDSETGQLLGERLFSESSAADFFIFGLTEEGTIKAFVNNTIVELQFKR